MSLRHLSLLSLSTLFFAACSSNSDLPPMAGTSASSQADAEALFQKAKQLDDSGKSAKAVDLYDKAAKRFPSGDIAAKARFRQGQILEQQKNLVKAFDAYQELVVRNQVSNLYSAALARQAAVAQAAADGEIKTSFLGLKSSLPEEKVAGMLGKVRDNAPKSPTASRAQYTLGNFYNSRGKAKEAITAFQKVVNDYPGSSEAPESQFRIGMILTQEADRGNQNQANVNQAREAFQDYLNQYPNHSRAGEARKMLGNLGGRDVQRSFDIAEFYRKSGQAESAKVYYREVVRRSNPGPLQNSAKAHLAELGEH